MAVALAYHGALHAIGLGYPWDSFLFNPIGRYDDWFTSIQSAATPDPYLSEKGGAYFPFAYIALRIGIAGTPIASLAIFKIIGALLIAGGVWLFWKNRRGDETAGLLAPFLLIAVLNYPLWYGLDRGNIDLWMGGLCLIYIAKLERKSWIGPIALGIAIALKGYPLAFILLGLRQHRYGESLAAIGVALALSFLALAQFDSGIVASWHGFQKGQSAFYKENVIGSASLFGTSDPYNGLRAAAWIALHAKQQFLSAAAPVQAVVDTAHPDPHEHAKFLAAMAGDAMTGPRVAFAKAYTGLTTLLAGISALCVLFVPLNRWRRVTLMVLVAILYPNLAGDYKLLLLLPAVFALLSDPAPDPARRTAFILMALLMVPKSYLYFYGLGLPMLLNPILLIGLWALVIWQPQAWRQGLQSWQPQLRGYLSWRS